MTYRCTFVIVGAGPAGATAVQTLREVGFDGDVLLLGPESLSADTAQPCPHPVRRRGNPWPP